MPTKKPKMQKPKIPTKKFSLALRSKLLGSMPLEFRKPLLGHVNAVSRTAAAIAKAAKAKGININVKLVERSSLLHDINMGARDLERAIAKRPFAELDKKISRKGGLEIGKSFRHERIASDILKRKGYPEVARAIGRHGDRPPEASEKFFSIEDRLLDLVDSRTMGDKFVSLDEKLKYLVERYGTKERLPPGHKTPEAYIKFITAKFGSLKRFEEELKRKGIDVDDFIGK